eukprot:CAMPEP_0181327024 /NCGR_PEP_ID=MMETSP1101-20121128/21850_1 /TAXON_ID=46948 /ORGANISM="Rhodomonas abbreviata, Strain Caron Lab Isolate" /LENGTH=142 /DNA_ID=CAMNT_0023435595 /DNA_START=26 /DNA_END=454 /DNA_ORIENTATION=+
MSKRAAASVLAIVALGLVASVVLISQNNWTVELSSTQTLAGGLQVTDVKVGSGAEPQPGQKIKVHYVGKLTSGTVFDQGDISFAFDRGQVIKGWDEGLKGMKVGGERNLRIPPALAYGSAGTPGGPIPPDATLLFSVKLLAV